jgi:1,4-dihydroxy-2-naphthoate octaprenyltransferase
MLKKIHFWLENARYVSLPQSLLPAITAIFIASSQTTFSIGYALLAVVGVAFTHLSFNLFDDYFDFKKNDVTIRNQLSNNGIRSRIGKCNYLTSGEATTKQLFWAAFTFGMIGLAFGIFFFIVWGFPILVFILVLAFLGIFYSAPPLRISYHGLGELLIGFVFGPLLMAGVCFSSSGVIPTALWFLSFPIGILVSNILFTHDIMDFEADKIGGKKTLAVVVNNQKINLIISLCFIYIPYLIMLSGVIFGFLSPWFCCILLSLPQAIKLHDLLRQFLAYPEKQFYPKWWMQPMEKWEGITKAGIDWFMIRWYLSRNLLMLFCFSIILINIFIK